MPMNNVVQHSCVSSRRVSRIGRRQPQHDVAGKGVSLTHVHRVILKDSGCVLRRQRSQERFPTQEHCWRCECRRHVKELPQSSGIDTACSLGHVRLHWFSTTQPAPFDAAVSALLC